MNIRKTLVVEIGQAFKLRAEAERAGALRGLMQKLLNEGLRKSDATEADTGAPERPARNYDESYRSLQERSAKRPLHEIDISIFARAGERDRTVCALALIFGLPLDLAERCIFGADPSLLLMACRSENFAWSTANDLIQLDEPRAEDRWFCVQANENYHQISQADAHRFMRLLHVNLLNRAMPGADQAPTGTPLRWKVK